MKRLQAVVRGHVQGVGFRYFVQHEARVLGLSGWVRNSEDGRSVEVVAEGDKPTLRQFEAVLREGPAFSAVSEVEAKFSDAEGGHEGFEIRW